jgi:hypothetical protein
MTAGVVCPEAAAPQKKCGRGGPLNLLSCKQPLDAFTPSAERLQSKLVQTFLSTFKCRLCKHSVTTREFSSQER